MITINQLLIAVVVLVVAAILLYFLWWALNYLGLPEPLRRVAVVIIALIGLIVLIGVLMYLLGHPLIVLGMTDWRLFPSLLSVSRW